VIKQSVANAYPVTARTSFYTRSQSYDFWTYSYNASVVIGWSVFTS
jgi:hypothetical protein